ncbi:MAG: GNAT family protein [Verrucomicrobiota bacterium]
MPTIPVAPGLRLVDLQPEDADELFALTDANRAYLRRWLPWLDLTRGVAATETFIDFARREARAGTALQCAIWEQQVIVGMCGFNQIDRVNRSATIGYWLAADTQGRGVMTRCVTALTLHGFTGLGLHRAVVAIAEGNARSEAVALRCGFAFEGVARDAEWLYDRYVNHRVFARLRTDA